MSIDKNYSAILSGIATVRKSGSTDVAIDLGNATKVEFSAEAGNEVKISNLRVQNGGDRASIKRGGSFKLALSLTDFSPFNIGLITNGLVKIVDSATATESSKVVYKDYGLAAPTKGIIKTLTSVKSGTKTLVEGKDYVLSNGNILLDNESADIKINDTVEVEYMAARAFQISAGQSTSTTWEFALTGINEFTGKAAKAIAYAVKFDAEGTIPLIGEDFTTLELTGTVLSEGGKPPYEIWLQEDEISAPAAKEEAA